jgi:hypothetical protein
MGRGSSGRGPRPFDACLGLTWARLAGGSLRPRDRAPRWAARGLARVIVEVSAVLHAHPPVMRLQAPPIVSDVSAVADSCTVPLGVCVMRAMEVGGEVQSPVTVLMSCGGCPMCSADVHVHAPTHLVHRFVLCRPRRCRRRTSPRPRCAPGLQAQAPAPCTGPGVGSLSHRHAAGSVPQAAGQGHPAGWA